MRIEPPISEPMPHTDPHADIMQASPPELPPTIRDGLYGLRVVPVI
ncbi:hypothetical protein BpHYR1_019607 [Brachionus plicatilis]|uniref:Uncharacterized protein n=1 Tax=Brachionus plicatilis TaxID=10195 RepID=A0A3M7P2Y6_BRAPC|nr:hypothetical protein BpHYR1_019607 [Brachionus plicatilis]